MPRLQDKVIVVTGAGSGFGRGIAKACAAEGAKLVISDVHENPNTDGFEDDAALTTAEAIQKAGGQAVYVGCDVTKSDQVATLVAETVKAFGRLDVMINNAGGVPRREATARVHRGGPRRLLRRQRQGQVLELLGGRLLVCERRSRGGLRSDRLSPVRRVGVMCGSAGNIAQAAALAGVSILVLPGQDGCESTVRRGWTAVADFHDPTSQCDSRSFYAVPRFCGSENIEPTVLRLRAPDRSRAVDLWISSILDRRSRRCAVVVRRRGWFRRSRRW